MTTPEGTHGPCDQAALFRRLRWAIFRNACSQMFGTSMVRPISILLSTIFVCLFVFIVSYAGFYFVINVTKIPPHGLILEILIGLLFFSLGVLLIFSGGLILHGSLFSAAETNFLLSKPVAADQVFAYKFHGAIAFSSWAFILLGGPLLIAYGLVSSSPWYFYLALPLFFFGFVLLPGSLAAILCFLLVNFLPKRRKELAIVTLIVVLLGIGLWIWAVAVENRKLVLSSEVFTEAANQFLARISFSRSSFLPSGWVARGVAACGRGDLPLAGYYLALVWTNGLFLYLVAAWTASVLYRRGFNRTATGGDLRKKHGGAWMDNLLSSVLWFLPAGTRLLIVKDFRTFRRDPQQYGQVLLFVGILVLYFSNIKRLFVREVEWPYQNFLSLLNLISICLLLSAYTGRFIYPLLSLEGRKFWILGLLPVGRDQLLWGKFVFATLGGWLLAQTMLLLSDFMLEMPLEVILVHSLVVAVLAAGLSGLSVGLGALMPNFRESDPSKIAVGFGGTVNLIVGLGFLLVVLALMALPWHLFMMSTTPEGARSMFMWPVVIVGMLAGIVVGIVGVVIPLKAAIRSLEMREF
jgi:ABC-2 type transport system permease protein